MFSDLYARLKHWLDTQVPYYAEPPQEDGMNRVPLVPPEPPGEPVRTTPWHVTLPGKYRPYILADKETEADAITALEEIAAHFAEADWTLDWKSESVCEIRKPCPEGLLISRLAVLTGTELALRP